MNVDSLFYRRTCFHIPLRRFVRFSDSFSSRPLISICISFFVFPSNSIKHEASLMTVPVLCAGCASRLSAYDSVLVHNQDYLDLWLQSSVHSSSRFLSARTSFSSSTGSRIYLKMFLLDCSTSVRIRL